ncbi:MAG: NAD(P)H-binding protein [Acidobacteriota bacterium]
MTCVLVAGADERLGKLVAGELAQRGVAVTASNTVAKAAVRVEVVFSCLGHAGSPGDVARNLELVAEARRARVHRFVYVSALHAGRFPASRYLAAHAQVAGQIKQSRFGYGILEPAPLFSEVGESASLGILYGKGLAQSNPIDDGDLARLCVDLIEGVGSMVVPVGGPEILTARQITEAAGTARIRRIPSWTLRAASALFAPISANYAARAHLRHLRASRGFVAPALGSTRLAEYFKNIRGA